MIDLTVESEIRAPAAEIWKALADLPGFADWNPFIRSAAGELAVGARLTLRVKPSLPVPLVFRPTVLVCDANRQLRWRGRFLAPWIASGEHTFTLEPGGDGCTRFVQHERFTGLLPLVAARLIAREARRGFEAMNQALKARVERARPAAVAAAVVR
jgi:hypothetical protein